jgi:hypothetical protein
MSPDGSHHLLQVQTRRDIRRFWHSRKNDPASSAPYHGTPFDFHSRAGDFRPSFPIQVGWKC